ncbi:MAG: topoisomerase IV [Clostridia bacterium]|nr:topoisomerase IV [Clostridia bacterium]
MAKKKKEANRDVTGETAPLTDQLLIDTMVSNYMPYSMSVIISRAIPEIDGFKPAHRKLLYMMYKTGLLTGPRKKSSAIVGDTMKLNPHGDASIYETMVRLTRGNEALLHPFIDSKGSFGKQYSSDMAYAAPRYTEAKLDAFCAEIFRGIDKNAVDMVPNYDNTMTEPVLLPTAFPNVLVSANMGIAVGMASQICSFNLGEICDGAIQVLRNPHTDVDQMLDIVKAPDFPGGGFLIYNRQQMADIYRTGRGSISVRARYVYDKSENCIDIIQIPYSTTVEAIMKKLTELVRDGKLKEISDFRDEIDLSGFKLTIDLKKGTDPDQLMNKLYKLTPLQDKFACNFNVLVNGVPRQMGIIEILQEWITFRMGCVKRELSYELDRKNERLHLLLGLAKILLDIDKAIRIVRNTPLEKDVVPNLMEGFSIDEIQANYIAEIKLRNLNREYILNRTKEIESLQQEIADLTDLIGSEARLKTYISKQLKEIKNKYGKARMTQLIYDEDLDDYVEEEQVDTTPVRLWLTKEGYFKKITQQALRTSGEQKVKEGDEILLAEDTDNSAELIFFSDGAQCYKSKVSAFETTKASLLGDYVAGKLGFDNQEKTVFMKSLKEYKPNEYFIFIFANGKGVKVPVSAYDTKSNRKKLSGAYSDASPIVAVFYEKEPIDLLLVSDAHKAIQISSSLIPVKTTRTSQGVTLMSLKSGQTVSEALPAAGRDTSGVKGLRKIKIPATGVPFERFDPIEDQVSLL